MLAVSVGRSVRFLPAAQLILELKHAQEAGRLSDKYAKLAKADLLILDEFGYTPLDSDGGRLLFQVMSDSYEKQSLVIVTNVEFGKWGAVLADEKPASALIDRLCEVPHYAKLGASNPVGLRPRRSELRITQPAISFICVRGSNDEGS